MKRASILFSKCLPSVSDVSSVKTTDVVALLRKIN